MSTEVETSLTISDRCPSQISRDSSTPFGITKTRRDAVGISTVLEVIQAHALSLEVAGFSCLTNLAAGLSQEKLSYGEVLEVGNKAATDFARLLSGSF